MTYHWSKYWVNWNSFEDIMGLKAGDRRPGLKNHAWGSEDKDAELRQPKIFQVMVW